MGMFDYFNCEYDLPKYPYFEPAKMQTKDLENNCLNYTLSPYANLSSNEPECYACGHKSDVKNNSNHTGWVHAYDYVSLDKNFNKIAGYNKNEDNYLVRYNFHFEFSRGVLLSKRDSSYAEKLRWDEEKRYFEPVEKYDMEEFLELYNATENI